MTASKQITLFLDIGGVLLSNGWDHQLRERAAKRFGLEKDEFQDRHHMIFGVYETGRITLNEYLQFAVFYKERPFTMQEFKDFMFAQSRADEEMIALIRRVKAKYGLKAASLNNEGTELNIHRIKKFGLAGLIDIFISSCFVHIVKPDPEMFRTALALTQAEPDKSIYLEDRGPFVEAAASFGINGIRHESIESTRGKLVEFLEKKKAA